MMPPENNDAQADAIARGDVLPPAAAPEPEQEGVDLKADDAPDEGKAKADDAPDESKAKADDAPDEGKAKADDDDSGKDHRVPKSRFDEAVSKERQRADAAQAELERYRQREQQLKEAEDTEAAMAKQKDLLKKHSSLLADGDLDKAAEVMEEVLQLRDDMQNARMAKQADNARNSAKIEVQYDQTVARLEAEYPEINPDADEFDQAVVANVQAMVTGIMQNEGKNPAEALEKATDILLKPLKEARGKDLRDKPSEEAVEQGMRRQQQQIDKNLKAAAQQPPESGEVGQNHDQAGGPLDVAAIQKMSWEEFIKVPDEELAKMRGDFIN